MSRLVDYFAVIGYDHEQDRGGTSYGKLLQRFPEKDWEHCPFTPGIELFCQPAGWELSTQRQAPTFFVSVLTDIDADRHYCACLSFSEEVARRNKHADEDEDLGSQSMSNNKMFAPKSLVLVSRLHYLQVFRNCLGLIYTVYTENMQAELETLIGNLLGCIQVPPPGGPQVRFSLGAGDRQALQPSLSPTLPVTRTSVVTFFHQLGLSNALSLICAALTDHKILFHSQSYTRLTEASHALTSLMYPLKYCYVYIPLLPSGLIEVLSTPTPFIAGVHSQLLPDPAELLDVIICDLDGGSLKIPEQITISLMPEPMYTHTVTSLYKILHPDLLSADLAFPSSTTHKPPAPEMLDKEIRAVFLRFFAEFFFGYRSCLTIIRIHPEPFITFHKANFLGHRSLVEDDFTSRVLSSMSFNTYVGERGPPFRVCDTFDEVFSTMPEVLQIEDEHCERLLHNLRDLAQQLYTNENPATQPYQQKVPHPPEGCHLRVHQPPFPHLDRHQIQDIIEEGLAKQNIKAKLTNLRPTQPRVVPMGTHIAHARDRGTIVATNVRRLEVLRNCVTFIFDNKISDARKIFAAVLRALKSRAARIALTEELGYYIDNNRALLEHQQFDLVVKLLNCALQNDSAMDENGVAAAILPLATTFCRKLCTGVIQFAYTCVQEHAVWANQQFWEATFYQDVQQQIRQLYLPQYEDQAGQIQPKKSNSTPDSKRRESITPQMTSQLSALEIAAEQLRVWPSLGDTKKNELIGNEESTVFSQAIHYANRMVYMRVPMDSSRAVTDPYHRGGDSASSNVTNSIADSDSVDAESGFEEQEVSEVAANVTKVVARFVDKVCTESSVTVEHIRQLHSMIPGVVHMHMETLDAVFRESMRLPPTQKRKILTPTLLPGEEIVIGGMRVYLVKDGREEGTGGNMGGPALLPAEGAVFLTTYRIVFKGTPCDPLACEQIVCRSFPVSSLSKEKKLNSLYLDHLDESLQDGLQLRSYTLQLMKIAFDEEVTSDDQDELWKLIKKLREPLNVMNTFAFTGYILAAPSRQDKARDKNASLKRGEGGFAKRTLMKTAKKAGIKKESSKPHKYILPTPPTNRRTLPASFALDRGHSPIFGDELAVIDESEMNLAIQTDSKNIERLSERAYCRDWLRQGLGGIGGGAYSAGHPGGAGGAMRGRGVPESWRISMVNTGYAVCKSYPAVLVVPQVISDDSIRKFARTHRQNRLPVLTWRHPRTRAALIRASGFHGKGVMGMLKTHHSQQPELKTSTSEHLSASVEQEKYFRAIVNATPQHQQGTDDIGIREFAPNAFAKQPPQRPQPPNKPTGRGLSTLQESRDTSPTPLRSTYSRSGHVNSSSRSANQSNPPGHVSSNRSTINQGGPSGHVSSRSLANQSAPPGHMSSRLANQSSARSSQRMRTGQRLAMTSQSSQGQGGAERSTTNQNEQDKNDALGRLGSQRDAAKRPMSTIGVAGHGFSGGGGTGARQNGTIDLGEGIGSHGGLQSAMLYVLGEKSHVKGIKVEAFPRCDFIPVDYSEVKHVRSSFRKLMRACTPSAPYTDPEKGYLRALEESDWLPQISNLLQISGAVVDLLDMQGASVMLCLEDGWDFATQVSTIAQVLLDPYYRTLEGFCVLIDKEFLGFGHRFTNRSNQTQAHIASGFAPIFLQFLDAVHQIHSQFPMSFEFNQYLLKFLAYHHVSNRFRTFMMDSECERMEAGWLLEEHQRHKQVYSPSNGELPSASMYSKQHHVTGSHDHPRDHTEHAQYSAGMSIWDYISIYHGKSPVFYNFVYAPQEHDPVLRPYSNIANLKVWDYYLKEDLSSGPSYDMELAEKEQHTREEEELIDGPLSPSSRRVVNGCYDNVDREILDSCSYLLQEIGKLEHDIGIHEHWQTHWDSLEPACVLGETALKRYPSIHTQQSRAHGRSIHKRSTLEVLVKGKLLGEAAKMFSQPHRFEKFTYTTPAHCDYCSHVLWGLVKTGMRCSDCGYNCHEKCTTHVPKNCTRLRPVSEMSGSASSVTHKHAPQDSTSVSGDPDTLTPAPPVHYNFTARVTEHKTHEGYLFKRGHLLKGWKQRWFVLDSMKHQLRYYDSQEDSNCKGFIDLKEVQSVTEMKNPQGLPKRGDENAMFEMKTQKRVYNFQAPSAKSAQKWIDEVQSCIQ